MTAEVRKIYNPQTGRELFGSRMVVMTDDNGYETNILIGVGNRSTIYRDNHNPMDPCQFSVNRRYLYQAHIAIVMDVLGNMRIVKNRTGRDNTDLTNLEIRQELWTSFENMGLGYYECALMMGNFNQAVSECLDEPVFQNEMYPLGINYRDYMRRGIMIKDYKIKRHSLL
jgi:hypothetical protein